MNKIKHIIFMIIAFGFLFMVLAILDNAGQKVEKNKSRESESVGNHLKTTTVINVSPTLSQSTVEAFAEVKAHWKTPLKARKQGEVLTISKHLQEGKHVAQGEVLVTFDNRHYQTLIAESKHQIAQAELLLDSEKQQAKLARSDWKLTRKKGSPSAFALRTPQIKAAHAQLDLAKAQLHEIKKTASYSKITAPYNGTVISRTVNLGEVVETGQVLAEIISSDKLDIKVMLNELQWQLLDDKWQGQEVKVYALHSHQQWSAIIEHEGGMIDRKTRQHLLHLRINSKNKPLVGGFVRVEIKGKTLANLLKIPASALTADGWVWRVDDDDKLQRFQADVAFSKDKNILIHTPELTNKSATPQKNTGFAIVVSPLSSYLPGLRVKPKVLSVAQSQSVDTQSTKTAGR